MGGELIALGLVNWIASMIVVESELFREMRQWVANRFQQAVIAGMPDIDFSKFGPGEQIEVPKTRRVLVWNKINYFVNCHLCTGVWIGFAEAAAVVHPLIGSGFVGFVLTALGIKAIGHVALEIVARVKGS